MRRYLSHNKFLSLIKFTKLQLNITVMSHNINENSKKRSRFPKIDILYEDSELIIVEKPYGMLSVPGKTTKEEKKLPRYLEWGISIKRAADEISKIPINELELDINCVEILNNMLLYDSIPRKEKQFHTYLQRLLKIEDETIRNQIWEYLTIIDNKLHKRDIDLIPLHLVSVFELVENILGHRIYTCHRLDMETSGVIMFAKNVSSCALLNKMFETREISKSYIAKVAHKVDQDQVATISVPMRPDPNSRIVQIVDFEEGKECETKVTYITSSKFKVKLNNYSNNNNNNNNNDNNIDDNNNNNNNNNNNAVDKNEDVGNSLPLNTLNPYISISFNENDADINEKPLEEYTIVKLKPVTGRTHQLRVHMNHCGHPILGDTLYGSLQVQKRSTRLCLHAFYITFLHPKTKEIMKVFSNGCEFVDQNTFDIIVEATKTE